MVDIELTDETYSELIDFRAKLQGYLRKFNVEVNDDRAVNEAILQASLLYDDEGFRKKYLGPFEKSFNEEFMKLGTKERKDILRRLREKSQKSLK